METATAKRTVFEHAFDGGRKIAKCYRCLLVVDATGKPDPTWYSPEWIEHFNQSPEPKCDHISGKA
jgi:hypothetical protein